MAPVPTAMESADLPGSHAVIDANQDTTCCTLRDLQDGDLVHLCDWPAAREVIDRFMLARAQEQDPATMDDRDRAYLAQLERWVASYDA